MSRPLVSHPAVRRMRALVLDAFASLLARPGRSIAMVAGIVLGVASATAAVLLADTQQAQIDRRFDLQRSGYAIVRAQQGPPGGFDRAALADIGALPVVAGAGEVSVWKSMATVSRTLASPPLALPAIGIDAGGARAIGVRTPIGLDVQAVDTMTGQPVVWLGRRAAARLGVDPGRGPTTIVMAGQVFSVAGVVAVDPAFEYAESGVLLPRGSALARLGAAESVRLVAKVRPGSAAAVAAFMAARADPSHELSFQNATPPDGEILLGAVTTDLRAAGLAVGGFVGLVGMITIANTLTMSVTQRTRELGLRSAMGWSRRRIGGVILVESALAGTVASIIGCAAGMAGAAAWAVSHGWQLVVEPLLPPAVIVGGILACIIGGALPARRASTIAPMTAMRD